MANQAAINEYANLVVPPPGQLTPWAKYFQNVILRRDYDTLFRVLPLDVWGSRWKLGKYSFRDVDRKVYDISQRFLPGGGTPTITTVREYVPFSENAIRRFVNGPYYKVSPAYADGICPPERLEIYADGYWNSTKAAAESNRVTDRAHVYDIWPGKDLCIPPQASLWVRIRSKVYIAVAIVAAVYLGPIVMDKIGTLIPGGAATGEAGAVTSKATFFQRVKAGADTVLTYVNKARTINAIVHGELPPPPIGIAGDSFREWAMIVVKDKIIEEAKTKAAELGVEYIQKKMTEREEAKLRAEIAEMQRKLLALVPPDAPMKPDAQVPIEVQEKMVQEKTDSQDVNDMLSIAVPLGIGALLLAG